MALSFDFSSGQNWARFLSGLGSALSSRGRGGTLGEGLATGLANYDQSQQNAIAQQMAEERLKLEQEASEARRTEASRKAAQDRRWEMLFGDTMAGVPMKGGPVRPDMPRGVQTTSGSDPMSSTIANLPPNVRAALSQMPAEEGQAALVDYLLKMGDPLDAPTVKDFYEGGELVQKQWNGKEWVEVGRGARFAPQQPGSTLTERQRNAAAAGLVPGTPEYNAFILGKGEGQPFEGTGVEQQALNIVLKGNPASPEYAAAYAQLAQPKVTFDPVTQRMISVQPDMTWARRPSMAGTAPAAPAAQPGVTTTQVPGATITSNQGAPVFNETQGKAAGFTDRMLASNSIFDDPSVATAGQDVIEAGKSAIPLVGNFLTTEARQRFEQAERDFINAQLRRESGAVISEEEFRNARKQYIPQPGDGPDVLAQKKANRDRVVAAMAREGGPHYKPTKPDDPLGILD